MQFYKILGFMGVRRLLMLVLAAQYGRPLYFAAVVSSSFFFSSPVLSGCRLYSARMSETSEALDDIER